MWALCGNRHKVLGTSPDCLPPHSDPKRGSGLAYLLLSSCGGQFLSVYHQKSWWPLGSGHAHYSSCSTHTLPPLPPFPTHPTAGRKAFLVKLCEINVLHKTRSRWLLAGPYTRISSGLPACLFLLLQLRQELGATAQHPGLLIWSPVEHFIRLVWTKTKERPFAPMVHCVPWIKQTLRLHRMF